MFYPVQEFDYYRDANNAPIIQDGPVLVHSNYILRPDLASTVAWVVQSGDDQLKKKMRRAIKLTFISRLVILLTLAALICVGLQLVLGTFSAYIFWVLIIVIALAFSQLMSLSKYIHILNAPNDPEVVTYTMEPDWTAPPPPPTYSRATAIPPAYESPKVSSPNLPTSQLPSSSSNPPMAENSTTSLASRILHSLQRT